MNIIPGIIDILSYCRPHNGDTVAAFCHRFLDVIPGMEIDPVGNRQLLIGPDNPSTLWSAHVDTMHAKDGRQSVHWGAGGIISLAKKHAKPGNCLGADNGAGVWMLLNLIHAGVPGLYLFHQGEERGGIGSRYIAANRKGILGGIKRAIAFDRKGTDDLIYEMAVGETASLNFAQSFCDLLNDTPQKLDYKPSNRGSFTDTASYADEIPECCNISIGYENEHGPRETLNYVHLRKLRDAMLLIAPKLDNLPTDRKPGDYGIPAYAFGASWASYYRSANDRQPAPYFRGNVIGLPAVVREELSELTALVRENAVIAGQICDEIIRTNPRDVAQLFQDYGISASDFEEEIALYS